MRTTHSLLSLLTLLGCATMPVPLVPVISAGSKPASTVSRPSLTGQPALEVYFVRHGETVSNATGKYNSYGINRLSAKGERQVAETAGRLRAINFDFVICSPSARALRTAAPILKEHNKKAEIWPEFNECSTEHGAARQIPASKRLAMGGKISPPNDLAAQFTVNPVHNRLYAPANYQDGIRQTQLAYERFQRRFAHQGGRVLIVGHSAQGSRFLDLLLGRKPVGDIQLLNGSVTVLKRQPNGTFRRA